MRLGRHREAAAARPNAAAPTRRLGVADTVSLIVGVVIGAGIFETAPLVFANVGGAGMGLLCWVLGGVLSLVGACCYAELASTYPRAGGDYVYLRRAFGPPMGFFFAWSQLALILTASIGMMAYVFADYAGAVFSFGERTGALVAAGAVLVLTALNLASISVGKTTQNLLTVLKVIGLASVVVAGFWQGGASAAPAPAAPVTSAAPAASVGLAMILVLYTYGGWNDAAFVAAEMKEKRHIARSLLLGTGLVTLIYLVVNAAFVAGLGFDGVRASRAVAADLLGSRVGPAGRTGIAVLVMISALGAANGLILMGARVHASLGRDYSGLAALGRWSRGRGQPFWALVVQAAVTIALIVFAGLGVGRSVVNAAFARLGVAGTSWNGHGGFDTLLRCSAPAFWFFFLMTGVSLFVLRARDPHVPRPFRVPLYPLTPLIFCATCAWMLVSSIQYAERLMLLIVPFLLLGIPFYFTRRRTIRPPLVTRVTVQTHH